MAQNNIPYSPVPTVEPSSGGSGATYQNVPEANPNAFGAQIGEAESKFGQAAQQTGANALDVAADYARMATTARVENDFANTYAPMAAALKQKFDSLDDKDKIAGSVDYLNGLRDLQNSFTGNDSSYGPLGKQLMSQLIGRHIFSETTGINREIVDSTNRLAAQGKMSMIAANNGYAAQNYNNPAVIDQMEQSNAGLRTLQVADAGHDIATPEGSSILEQYQRDDRASMADAMFKAAMNDGNIAAAMRIRGTYNNSLPGYQQLAQDKLIHIAGMKQFGASGVAALAAGQPLPQVASAPPAAVQAIVANRAQTSGIDPNDALTVAAIESSMGQNVGSRGTIGQDKGSAGQPLDAQAQALCDNWKAAHDPAAAALGREPEKWEQYTIYQQGAGGGAALLKANPNAKAVDVLRPFYSNPKDALSAITHNGGNAAMTVSDFLEQEKQRWNDSFERARCDFSPSSPPGNQILDAHLTPGTMVQPAANPMQDYRNWQKANIQNMQQIMAMPSGPARDALLKEDEMQTQKREQMATAYKGLIINQAAQLAQDPNFTSMQQIPPEMYSTLLEVDPYALGYMENRAQYNLSHHYGVTTEDQNKYGTGMGNILNGIWDGSVKSITQLHEAVSKGDLTIAGYDRALKELGGRNTPDGVANSKLREQTFKAVRSWFLKKSDILNIPDPHAEETYGHAMSLMYKAEEDGMAKGLTANQLYDPTSKDWIGNAAKGLVKSQDQTLAEINGQLGKSGPPPLNERVIGQTYQSPNGPVKWTGTGWVKEIPPSVPIE